MKFCTQDHTTWSKTYFHASDLSTLQFSVGASNFGGVTPNLPFWYFILPFWKRKWQKTLQKIWFCGDRHCELASLPTCNVGLYSAVVAVCMGTQPIYNLVESLPWKVVTLTSDLALHWGAAIPAVKGHWACWKRGQWSFTLELVHDTLCAINADDCCHPNMVMDATLLKEAKSATYVYNRAHSSSKSDWQWSLMKLNWLGYDCQYSSIKFVYIRTACCPYLFDFLPLITFICTFC